MQIKILEVLYAQNVGTLCNDISSGNVCATGQFVETDNGVLRWIPRGKIEFLEIVIPERLWPWLLNCAHNTNLVGHHDQSRM